MESRDRDHSLSRRDFLKGAAAIGVSGAVGGAAVGLAGCSKADAKPDWMPVWEAEADIIVIGLGAAGAAAAITANKEKLGSVIVLEAAPEGQEGGNSSCCAQILFIPPSVDGALKYQASLNERYPVEEELMKAWAVELVKNKEWLESLGAKVLPIVAFSPEFPEAEGSEFGKCFAIDGKLGGAVGWKFIRAQLTSLGTDIRYGARAIRLVRNPETNEALGVVIEKDGAEKAFKANKGVVLACGGFENNPEMIRDNYSIGTADVKIFGTPYNRGDGFSMIAPFGAKLWHMNAFSGTSYAGKAGSAKDNPCTTVGMTFSAKDYIFVGADAKRFMYEEKVGLHHHGKIEVSGVWRDLPLPTPAYAIFGQKNFEKSGALLLNEIAGWLWLHDEYAAKTNQGLLDAGLMVKCATIEDLASKLGLDAAALKKTIETYNTSAANGVDEFGRGQVVMGTYFGLEEKSDSPRPVIQPFALEPITAPYYAFELHCSILNTQGGPKRGVNGEVLNVEEKPVPRLYAAGEFGCIYPYLYNGGGNFSECLSSGRIAVRSISALQPWDNTDKA